MKVVKVLGKVNTGLLLLIVTYGLFWLFVGAYYSHPNAEDFSLTAAPKNEGIINAASHLLVTYDGRYFTNILHGINPMAMGWLGGYKWTIAFNILFFIFSIYYFVQSVNGRKYKLKTLLFSSLFVVIHFALTPSLVHELYWMVSSFVYLYCWCFTLLWLGSFVRFNTAVKDNSKQFYFTLTAFFLVCAIGINEMMLVINGFLIVIAGIFQFVYLRRHRFTIFLLSILALVSYAFFLLCPGITMRFGSFTDEHQGSHYDSVLSISLSHFSEELFYWFTQGGLFLFFLIIVLIKFRPIFGASLLERVSLKVKVLFFLFAFMSIFLMTFAFYVPMGHEDFIPHRIYTSVFLSVQLLLIFGFINLIPLMKSSVKKSKYNRNVEIVLFFVLSFLFVSIIYSENNIDDLKKDFLSGKMHSYDHQMQRRYSIIENSKADKGCYKFAVLDKLTARPQMIFNEPDIKPNRTTPYWNAAYEAYFEIREVRIEGDSVVKNDHIKSLLGNEQ